MKKKFTAVFVFMIVLAVLVSGCSKKSGSGDGNKPAVATSPESNGKPSKSNSVALAEDFVLHAYSDFSDGSKSTDDFICSGADGLKSFIADRKEILAYEKELTGKTYTAEKSEIESEDEFVSEGKNTVCLKIKHTYRYGDEEKERTVLYKVVVSGGDKPCVVAAISNDISAERLFSMSASSFDELNPDFQLNPDKNAKPYNLTESKENLKNLLEELKH